MMRIAKVGVYLFVVVSGLIGLIGVCLSVAMKEKSVADFILSEYPRYKHALAGYSSLRNMTTQIPDSGQGVINIGIISIGDDGFSEILDFLQSEVAIRKSDRNEAGSFSYPDKVQPGSSSQLSRVQPLNFYRIKTVVSTYQPIMSAGSKQIVPPYRLIVIFPFDPAVVRRIYEFLSFEEFSLDLRSMFVGEIETWSAWCGFIALALNAVVNSVRFVCERWFGWKF